MKSAVISITLLFVIAITGCGKFKAGTNEIPPDEVIRRHFLLLNEKNVDGAESCIVPDRRNQINWDLESVEYRKLISLHEDTNEAVLKSYMETGRGTLINSFSVKVFQVVFEVKCKEKQCSGLTDGEYTWNYFLVKQTEESPWLIDDWGI